MKDELRRRLARMFPQQRGIISLGFGSSDTKQTTTSQQTVDREQQTELESEKTSERVETLESEELTQLLSPEVVATLEGLLQGLTTGDSAATQQIEELTTLLTGRAATAEAELNAQSDAILAESRRQGEQTIGRTTTELASVTGSTQNTLVQQQQLELQNDLEAQLAALDAQLARENRAVATQEFETALAAATSLSGAQTADTAAIASIGELLKGSTSVVTGQQQVVASEEEVLKTVETLTELINSLTTGVSTASEDSFKLGIG